MRYHVKCDRGKMDDTAGEYEDMENGVMMLDAFPRKENNAKRISNAAGDREGNRKTFTGKGAGVRITALNAFASPVSVCNISFNGILLRFVVPTSLSVPSLPLSAAPNWDRSISAS